jgi:deoxyribonuclease (pyrimidine dimer)
MTRVNVVDPSELSRQHLIAEYREIPRIVSYTRKLLEKYNSFQILEQVPSIYRLGEGHVKFFSNKLLFIKNRHDLLKLEGIKRGYDLSSITIDIDKIPVGLCKDYQPTQEAIEINRNRIKERNDKNRIK